MSLMAVDFIWPDKFQTCLTDMENLKEEVRAIGPGSRLATRKLPAAALAYTAAAAAAAGRSLDRKNSLLWRNKSQG